MTTIFHTIRQDPLIKLAGTGALLASAVEEGREFGDPSQASVHRKQQQRQACWGSPPSASLEGYSPAWCPLRCTGFVAQKITEA